MTLRQAPAPLASSNCWLLATLSLGTAPTPCPCPRTIHSRTGRKASRATVLIHDGAARRPRTRPVTLRDSSTSGRTREKPFTVKPRGSGDARGPRRIETLTPGIGPCSGAGWMPRHRTALVGGCCAPCLGATTRGGNSAMSSTKTGETTRRGTAAARHAPGSTCN